MIIHHKRILPSAGFTLVEIIMVLAIVAIVAAVAAPNMSSMIDSARYKANLGQLVRDLNLARSEAVKRGEWVVVSTTSGSWSGGWRIFQDDNNDELYDEEETEIQVRDEVSGVSIASVDGFTSYIRYNPTGTSHTTGSFMVTSNSSDDSDVLCIGSTGQLKFSRCPAEADPCETSLACP
ncbi:MAG: GspH/FimT family protein [Magnetococcales bacterium]|nr:GspH/FimT family protein [Magnetococcales bacterium]